MKKYYIFALMFLSFLSLSIISPRVFTQSYRLTKVGYVDLDRVVKEVTKDEVFVENLKLKMEEQNNRDMAAETNNTEINTNPRDNSLRGQVKRQVASSLIGIVKKEGYTLILERTEYAILYADRNFDITDAVIKDVKESVMRK
ncbi:MULTISPECIES: OmpH family outer membrane protein [Brachyspira]|uniref:OmpH family outer membrane protein n=4 Tax=Brachyspira pilosicoli TaxID=52584 RepID=A0AAJ6G8J1_BRAPL|nr:MULTISPECIES: OmpH family outer membrane protein [Brachyspira]ADK31152.1 putative outer membrane chaperone Skp, OmpH [Brachyspira pilosicoli 95/1000]AFR71949.1 putative outer membrane chaperone OmpH [Brachyspira pilosicoli B2904]AGA67042.1 putative outer membrane chaperone OmpH [Brachyspira pilosicoli P43/6/78]MBW5378183.1 OmpH family outer membrane protein [Brachyspira pilosicoli]MBW5391368.1 OmpH family outer membrane protein [Brachyspira pilosicoli]